MGHNETVRDVRAVYDIRSGQKIGQITGLRDLGWKESLSADGRLFAMPSGQSRGVILWDVLASREKATMPLPDGLGIYPFNFAGSIPTVACNSPRGTLDQIWKLPAGNKGSELRMSDECWSPSLSFSPGGRYAAVYCFNDERPRLQFYDMATRELVGESIVPKKGIYAPLCHVLMFSPDGREIAGLFEESYHGEFLLVWSLKDGSHSYEYRLEEEMFSDWRTVNYAPIQWFPKREQWLLFGKIIVDRGLKRIIWHFPSDEEVCASRRVLDDGEVLHLVRQDEKLTLENLRLFNPAPTAIPNPNALAGKQAGEKWTNSLNMVFCWCPKGTFTMGNPNSEQEIMDYERQVQVTLSKGFWIGHYEVTQSQWQQVMGNIPWHEEMDMPKGPDFPATFMEWNDAMMFCDNLTTRERKSGRIPVTVGNSLSPPRPNGNTLAGRGQLPRLVLATKSPAWVSMGGIRKTLN